MRLNFWISSAKSVGEKTSTEEVPLCGIICLSFLYCYQVGGSDLIENNMAWTCDGKDRRRWENHIH